MEEKKRSDHGPGNRHLILLVDDHPVFLHGLADLLRRQPDFEVVAHASSAKQALDKMRSVKPEIAILDIALPGTNGIELIKLMKAERPDLLILIVSMYDETLYALRALKAGAMGYIMKSEASEHVATGIRRILDKKIFVSPLLADQLIMKAVQSTDQTERSPVDALSDRELEILNLFGKGRNTRAISEALGVSIKTVETHRTHIKEKLGLRTANEMLRFAMNWVATQE